MGSKKEILIVAEKSGILPRTMADQLKELGYVVVQTELDIQQINELHNNFEAILLYMESEVEGFFEELQFLGEKADNEGIPVFYIGEDVPKLKRLIPSHVIEEVFERPVDVKMSAKKMDNYIQTIGKRVRHKILVVDDSGAMLRSVKEWLGRKYQVILANSGAMAIKYLATNRPDLVLLDYEMPVVDGGTVLQMMRAEEDFKDIPVIFLTSKADKSVIMKVMALKPEGYILKTTPPELIKQEVDVFFEKREHPQT